MSGKRFDILRREDGALLFSVREDSWIADVLGRGEWLSAFGNRVVAWDRVTGEVTYRG